LSHQKPACKYSSNGIPERSSTSGRDDHSGAADYSLGGGLAPQSRGGADAPHRDRQDRWEDGHGRHTDVRDHRGGGWAPESGNGRGQAATGRDRPAWSADGGRGHVDDAGGDRWWGPEHRRGGGCYPTAGASSAAGPRPARWDAVYDNDGPAPAPLELGVPGPVVTPIPGQPDIAHDWLLSASWKPPTPVTATEWRESLTSGQVVALFGYDPSSNSAAVGPREVTAAMVEYARVGLAGVVPPCLESSRTRAKRFNAALQRVLRQAGRPVHVWEYRSHD